MTCPLCGEDPEEATHAIHCSWQPPAPDDPILQARTGDPETSHKAMAAFSRRRMNNAMDVMVELLQIWGPMADFEQRPRFKAAWQAPCCEHLYRQARSSARDKGRIVKTDELRVNPATKREQVVWAYQEVPPPEIVRCETCGHILRRQPTEKEKHA